MTSETSFRFLRMLMPILTVLAGPAVLHGQHRETAQLNVIVVDSAGTPVQNARVDVAGVRTPARTDERGAGRITRVPIGNRIVTVSRLGFATARVAVEFRGDETASRTITLTSEAVELAGLSATAPRTIQALAQRGFYRRQKTGQGAFMSMEQIEQIRPLRTVDLFRRMRGFAVTSDRRGFMTLELSRGAASMSVPCESPLIFLDGVLVQARTSDREDMLSFIIPETLAAIEAYSGPATVPAEYNFTGSACGVVLLWTRSGPS